MYKLMNFQGTNVELLRIGDKVYFNPYDVGKCLGLCDSAIRMAISKMNKNQAVKLKNSDVKDIDIRNSIVKDIDNYVIPPSGRLFLTECGVYKLIFKSNKPKAEEFANWVTDEVLPSINKTGKYEVKQNNSTKKIEDKAYVYTDKYYKGQLVLTLKDLEYFTGIEVHVFGSYLRKWKDRFTEGVDYWKLSKYELRLFKKQNDKTNSIAKTLIIITKSGFDKLCSLINGVPAIECFEDKDTIPFYVTRYEPNDNEPINPNIKTDEWARAAIDTAKDHIDTLRVLLRSFDKYNNLSAYKAYQAAMLEVARVLYQRIIVISNLDVFDKETRIIPFRNNDKEWQNERKDLFGIKGEKKFSEKEALVVHGDYDNKHVFYLS